MAFCAAACDQIAGEHPSGFVGGGGETAGDVGKGDGSDGGVQHLHEGGQHDGGGDQPWTAVGTPSLKGIGVGVVSGHGASQWSPRRGETSGVWA